MPMNYNYLGNDVDSPTSMVNVVASALANSAREQREMELYRLRAQQLQEQGGDARLRAASALVRDIAAANLSGAKTEAERARLAEAMALGGAVYRRNQPLDIEGGSLSSNPFGFYSNMFSTKQVPSYKPTIENAQQMDRATAMRAAAVLQAMRDPSAIGKAMGGMGYGMSMQPGNIEQEFAGMTGKPSIETSAGAMSRNLLTGETIINPRPAGSPNMKPLSQAVIERLASGVSSGYLENEELPALFDSLMNLAQGGGAGDLPKITTQEQFDALPSGARYINRSGNVARKP
jgi:hypothetical protein